MKLETRVETLEHELKILKSEIQATLLEIQSQVLEHYYPALRAEMPAKEATSHQTGGVEQPYSLKIKEALRPRSAPKAGDDTTSSTVETNAKEVSLAEFREKQLLTPTLFLNFTEWVNNTVEKIGKANTQQMVDSATANDACPPEVRDLLLQLVNFSSEGTPPASVEPKVMLDAILGLNKLLATLPR